MFINEIEFNLLNKFREEEEFGNREIMKAS